MDYLISALIAWVVAALTVRRRFDKIDRYVEAVTEKLKEIINSDRP